MTSPVPEPRTPETIFEEINSLPQPDRALPEDFDRQLVEHDEALCRLWTEIKRMIMTNPGYPGWVYAACQQAELRYAERATLTQLRLDAREYRREQYRRSVLSTD
jgi:hypothetical protein